MRTKSFDCVERVEQIQEEIQERLETMSREEQLAFWRVQTERLRERQKRMQNAPRQQKAS
jgi:hypothetical protein